eukprot:TRINITY_DN96089_c0_g1_i1.p1 TRINITY_DN96089_c0_g1~~TRINITY_DN96089_c0_g1_i1.p1  ORF type:complete len:348 (+),score=109.64 TRINITY_DN96089_c0_g1_i1:45-1088(+)
MGTQKRKKKVNAEAEVENTEQEEAKPGKRKKESALEEVTEARPKKKKKGQAGVAEDVPKEKAAKSEVSEADAAKEQRSGGIPEDERRKVQREIQQLVVRLRAEGKSNAEIEAAKKDVKAKYGGSLKQPGHNKKKKKEKAEAWLNSDKAKEKRKANVSKEHELVVIPVFWRGRHDKLDVVKAAEDIKACVAQQGVDVWVDSRRQLTPGQKFAHWEHRGVMLRVEVGPEDLQAGVCRVCKAQTPGDYKSVERRKVKLPPAGARALLLALKEWGLEQIEIERREGDSDSDADQESTKASASKAAKSKQAMSSAEGAAEDELQGNWGPRMQKEAKGGSNSKKKKGKKAQSR